MCAGQDSQQALQAYIAPIKEVMPDFGEGFLAAALQHFSYNSEQVIHALLEAALPPELKALDPYMPLQSPSQQAAQGSKAGPQDKGKGKLPQASHLQSLHLQLGQPPTRHRCMHIHTHALTAYWRLLCLHFVPFCAVIAPALGRGPH